jgi:O-antigen ligase
MVKGSTFKGLAVLLCLGALAGGILLSLSRGAWLALMVPPIILLGTAHREKFYFQGAFRKAGTMLVILLFLAGAAYWSRNGAEMVLERVHTLATMESVEGGNSNADRILVTEEAVSTMERNWLGVGVGNARKYLEYVDGTPANHAENVYLQVALEQGLLGILGYGAVVGWVFLRLRRRLRRGIASWEDWAFFTINVQFMIFGLFNNLDDNMWYWTIFGLGIAQCNMKPCRRGGERHALPSESRLATPSVQLIEACEARRTKGVKE